jgi:hypothetical protein
MRGRDPVLVIATRVYVNRKTNDDSIVSLGINRVQLACCWVKRHSRSFQNPTSIDLRLKQCMNVG